MGDIEITKWHLGCEDEFAEDTEIIRGKWVMDGATTLSEAAARLRSFAQQLEVLEQDGWQLVNPVSDDYGFIHQPTEASS